MDKLLLDFAILYDEHARHLKTIAELGTCTVAFRYRRKAPEPGLQAK